MAWIKTASRYLPDWQQTSDDPAVWLRSVFVFFRDGLLFGIVGGLIIANSVGLPIDGERELRELQARNREAVAQATKYKAEWCRQHPETLMCRSFVEQRPSDFDQMK